MFSETGRIERDPTFHFILTESLWPTWPTSCDLSSVPSPSALDIGTVPMCNGTTLGHSSTTSSGRPVTRNGSESITLISTTQGGRERPKRRRCGGPHFCASRRATRTGVGVVVSSFLLYTRRMWRFEMLDIMNRFWCRRRGVSAHIYALCPMRGRLADVRMNLLVGTGHLG